MWEVEASGGGEATIEVNGQVTPVEVGGNFKETVIAKAQEYGLGKFRLFLNDEEILPSQAPATISAGDKIKLVAFDVAG